MCVEILFMELLISNRLSTEASWGISSVSHVDLKCIYTTLHVHMCIPSLCLKVRILLGSWKPKWQLLQMVKLVGHMTVTNDL